MRKQQRYAQDIPPEYADDDRYHHEMLEMNMEDHDNPPEYGDYFPEEQYDEQQYGANPEDYSEEGGAYPDRPTMMAMQPYEEEEPKVTPFKSAEKSGFKGFASQHMCIVVGIVVCVIFLIIIFVTNALVVRDWDMTDNRNEETNSIFDRPPNRNPTGNLI